MGTAGGDEGRLRRFAVLIDADNTSPRIAEGLFAEIARFGEASVRRIYGDFSSPRLKSWAEILQRFAIDPHQQFAYTQGKNASDIALVIDAMDLLHAGHLDGFCLVSSDSDFTRLASRLREHGAEVYGFGEQKTPESFRNACRRFIYTENLSAPSEATAAGQASPPVARQPLATAAELLSTAVAQMEADEDGWVHLGGVGTRVRTIAPDFDERTYGCRKLSELVGKMPEFEVKQSAKGMLIRPAARAKPRGTARRSPASGAR
ncbi:NYN domain-containing protein [Falsiroseomonas sp. HW251]|uniref:NYN domain-containing protein n=1 Tax=Falsiroseomonas sp. HW251 TaxID=3390998 RepID=UPI003D31154D